MGLDNTFELQAFAEDFSISNKHHEYRTVQRIDDELWHSRFPLCGVFNLSLRKILPMIEPLPNFICTQVVVLLLVPFSRVAVSKFVFAFTTFRTVARLLSRGPNSPALRPHLTRSNLSHQLQTNT